MPDENNPIDANKLLGDFEGILKTKIDTVMNTMKFDQVKKSLEKALDVGPAMAEFDKAFEQSADELSKSFKGALKDAAKTGTALQEEYQNFIRTKERTHFNRLKGSQ